MEILYNDPDEEHGYGRKRVISPEQQEVIQGMVKESFIDICENYGMPSRDKHKMQGMFLYLDRSCSMRSKIEEWLFRGVVLGLLAYTLKEALGA